MTMSTMTRMTSPLGLHHQLIVCGTSHPHHHHQHHQRLDSEPDEKIPSITIFIMIINNHQHHRHPHLDDNDDIPVAPGCVCGTSHPLAAAAWVWLTPGCKIGGSLRRKCWWWWWWWWMIVVMMTVMTIWQDIVTYSRMKNRLEFKKRMLMMMTLMMTTIVMMTAMTIWQGTVTHSRMSKRWELDKRMLMTMMMMTTVITMAVKTILTITPGCKIGGSWEEDGHLFKDVCQWWWWWWWWRWWWWWWKRWAKDASRRRYSQCKDSCNYTKSQFSCEDKYKSVILPSASVHQHILKNIHFLSF